MNATIHTKFNLALLLKIGLALLVIFGSFAAARPAWADASSQAGEAGIAQITGGLGHTVALKTDGTVWTWGDNQRGKLGAGKLVNRYTPSRLSDLTDVKAIASGNNHTLALKKDGSVWAWGGNNSGQLGDGTRKDSGTPVHVEGLNSIMAIAAGANHSVALREDGVVFAWGDNDYGQLGDVTTEDHDTPKEVVGLPEITSIASGVNHVLAVTKEKTVVGWGDNNGGQLGYGTVGGKRTYRVFVEFIQDVKAVAAGNNFSLALKEDGSVFAWGSDTTGQLGNSYGYHYINVAANPKVVTGLRGITAIAAGNTHAMAMSKDGDLYTWGGNQFGQLGIGNTDNKLIFSKIAGFEHTTLIGSGAFHAMAMKADGSVWTWGSNVMGQLGDGSTTNRTTPVMLPRFSLIVNKTDIPESTLSYSNSITPFPIAAGDGFTAVIKDGQVWTWGENTFGQLGIGSSVFKNTPQPVSSLPDSVLLSAKLAQAAALQKDGTVRAWGSNISGQFGDGTTENKNIPAAVPALTDVVSIGSGTNFSVFLKKDGSVWTTGDNSFGQQGDGLAEDRTSPAKVEGLPLIQAVAAGGYHVLALTPDGHVWSWGDNSSGQLGDGTTMPRRSPVAVPKLEEVTAIAAGRNFSLALKADGSVWAWGYNAFGQLGDGTTSSRKEPAPVSGLYGVKSIAAGAYHAIVVKSDGTVWSWGNNLFGQLGDGTTENRSTAVQVKAATGIQYVAAGTYHSAAIDKNEAVWTWGSNGGGQLGDGEYKSRSIPQVIVGFNPMFSDLAGHWAQSSIDAAVQQGMVDGYPDGTFHPDSSIARSELVKLVASALKLNTPVQEAGQPWYVPYEKALQDAGILRQDDLQGAWEDAATRGELARIAVRASSNVPSASAVDTASAMQEALKKGIMQGLDGGRLAPEDTTTRAQAIVVVERLLAVKAGTVLPVDVQSLVKTP
ncbi:S-layer homology domain-containing protein [Paenibacillus allorhizosphaerae]|uniref:SLH domain-containing protein n=1 Tax=Paenibacillus allorhizosphaerae TaxID=2849866 RepID=A0ABM8VFG7_9BACL|nr:S-layer homology domain-containing protein [Paenibacillus allorhizosphaerae]CAG7635053.1 hypothetical protein PAECIP111802_02093 [Paenibacillus allorhizosphaerae]